MSKLKAFAAVLKFINGRNDSKKYMQEVYDYITDPTKTDNGKLVATHGCSKEHPLEDICVNKKLWHKTNGKQGEHFVIALAPCGESKSPVESLKVIKKIVATVYSGHIAIIAGHTDSKCLHFHVILDAVNAVTGRKFSQSPSDLNRVKQKVNNILVKHGFEIITASANEFVDHTDHSNEEGFDFLELDESQFITESDIEEISTYTDSIIITNTPNLFCGWDYPSCNNNNFGGYHMNNNYTPYVSQAQDMPVATPTVEIVPSSVTKAQQTQELPAHTVNVDAVPATVETVGNSYPQTNLITGPTFHIKGNSDSDLSGLSELVDQATAYAQKHQREAANLALAMQQYGQQTGFPSNVSLYSGPTFDIDMTGGMYSPFPDEGNNNFY